MEIEPFERVRGKQHVSPCRTGNIHSIERIVQRLIIFNFFFFQSRAPIRLRLDRKPSTHNTAEITTVSADLC